MRKTLTLDNGKLHVEVIPELGGKLSSLRLNGGAELLQQPLRPYAARTREMAFDEGDASGFDECLPSVSGCVVQTALGAVTIPDHGDFWRIEWQAEQSGDEIRLRADGFSLPLRFEKTLRLEDSSVILAYRVTNLSDQPVEYAWSAHPLFTVDAGDRILLPGTVESVVVQGSAGDRLGTAGTRHNWPRAIQSDGKTVDLSIAGDIADGIGDKLYTAAPAEGWCAIERRKEKCRISVHFDVTEISSLGLWLCYGGWPEKGTARQQCVALEPCTAPVDSLAQAMENGSAKRLTAGQSDTWQITVRITGVS